MNNPGPAMTMPSVASTKQTLQVIWMAMVCALGAYWAVRVLVAHRAVEPSATFLSQLLSIMSVFTFVGAAHWWRWRMAQFEQQAKTLLLQGNKPEERQVLAGHGQSTVIPMLALLETPAVFGLVNGFAGGPARYLFEINALISLWAMCWVRFKGFPAIFEKLDG